MQKINFYKYSSIILLLLNLVLAFLLFQPRPHPPKIGDGKMRATEMMGLDKQQNDLFLANADAHRAIMDSISAVQLTVLQPYFKSLVQPNQVEQDSLLQQFQSLEKAKIESMYQHFQDIKTILKPHQYGRYEIFMQEILSKILDENKKNSPPRRVKK